MPLTWLSSHCGYVASSVLEQSIGLVCLHFLREVGSKHG